MFIFALIICQNDKKNDVLILSDYKNKEKKGNKTNLILYLIFIWQYDTLWGTFFKESYHRFSLRRTVFVLFSQFSSQLNAAGD